jgi:hypothetical protein
MHLKTGSFIILVFTSALLYGQPDTLEREGVIKLFPLRALPEQESEISLAYEFKPRDNASWQLELSYQYYTLGVCNSHYFGSYPGKQRAKGGVIRINQRNYRQNTTTYSGPLLMYRYVSHQEHPCSESGNENYLKHVLSFEYRLGVQHIFWDRIHLENYWGAGLRTKMTKNDPNTFGREIGDCNDNKCFKITPTIQWGVSLGVIAE